MKGKTGLNDRHNWRARVGAKGLGNDQRKMNADVVDAEKGLEQVGIRCISQLWLL